MDDKDRFGNTLDTIFLFLFIVLSGFPQINHFLSPWPYLHVDAGRGQGPSRAGRARRAALHLLKCLDLGGYGDGGGRGGGGWGGGGR